MKLKSYVMGNWVEGEGSGVQLYNAVNGNPIAEANSKGIDFKAVLKYVRESGGPILRKTTFYERGRMLKGTRKNA